MMRTPTLYILAVVYLFIKHGNSSVAFPNEIHAIPVTCRDNLIDLLRRKPSDKYVVECPTCRLGACYVLGTSFYTSTSGLCCSGVHDGKINNNGSVLEVNVHGGRRSNFRPSLKHGVRSRGYHPSWGTYFTLTSLAATISHLQTTEAEVATISILVPTQSNTTQTTTTAASTTSSTAASTMSSTGASTTSSTGASTTSSTGASTTSSTGASTTSSTGASTTSSTAASTTSRMVSATLASVAVPTQEATLKNNLTIATSTARPSTHASSSVRRHTNLVETLPFTGREISRDNAEEFATSISPLTSAFGKASGEAMGDDDRLTSAVVYILVGVGAVAIVMIGVGIALARRFNHASWFRRRNRCRRSAQLNDCVCYVAMDSSVQGLLNDPETCERPCQMRELLQTKELDLSCSNEVEPDCSGCAKEKCSLSSKYDF